MRKIKFYSMKLLDLAKKMKNIQKKFKRCKQFTNQEYKHWRVGS